METKETIKEMLKRHEGVRNIPYRCSAGKSTIGVGWNIDANPLPPVIELYLKQYKKITDEMIDELLDISIRHAQADCRVLFPNFDTFTDARKMALIDFVFNVGFATARKFKNTIALINQGRFDAAADNMLISKWAEQVKGRSKTITEMIRNG